MTQIRAIWSVAPVFSLLLIATGCGSKERSASSTDKRPSANNSSSSSSATGTGESAKTAAKPEPDATESKPFKLGDLIEPFTPPPLAELDKTAQWSDSPVVDAMDRLREAKKKEPPLVTVQQALAMKNDSADANRKILSALSVLAPPDGNGVNWDATINRALIADLSSVNPILANGISEFEI